MLPPQGATAQRQMPVRTLAVLSALASSTGKRTPRGDAGAADPESRALRIIPLGPDQRAVRMARVSSSSGAKCWPSHTELILDFDLVHCLVSTRRRCLSSPSSHSSWVCNSLSKCLGPQFLWLLQGDPGGLLGHQFSDGWGCTHWLLVPPAHLDGRDLGSHGSAEG